jgi:hypothetical protein
MEEQNHSRRLQNSNIKKYVIGIAAIVIVLILFIKFNPFSGKSTSATNSSDKTVIKDAV